MKKRGRPPTERGAYNPNPNRMLGRVSDADWALIQSAAAAAGKPFTRWAMAILIRAAKRAKKAKYNGSEYPVADQ